MLAFRVKSKSKTEYVRLHDLHTCYRSAKISKSFQTQVKIFQQEAELDTFLQKHQDASSNKEVSMRNSTIAGFDGSHTQLLESSLFSPDPVSYERVIHVLFTGPSACSNDSLSETNPPNLETIFSPNLEYGDSQLKPEHHSDEGLPHLVADETDSGTGVSSEYQMCSLLDFYLSDTIASSPFDNNIGLADVTNTTYPTYEFVNSNIMVGMVEEYTRPPFLERTMETSNVYYGDAVQETMTNFDEACLYLAIHPENETNCNFGDLEETECFDEQLVFQSLADLPQEFSSICPILLPAETRERKLITLVLDLDETLVHSTMEHCDDADFTFPVFFNMKQHMVYVRERPFLQMFLERVAQMFEIVIFTASQSIYAEKLLDILDPDKKIISKRVYGESCLFSEGNYTKDLTILGVDLARVAIIDNTPQVFHLQVNNGIPIKSWFGDPCDQALVQLLPFLETLVDVEDVRPIIAKKFGNNE